MTMTPHRARTVLDLPDPEPGWEDRAACRTVDPAAFYLAPGKSRVRPDGVAACAACPVPSSCLVDAVRGDDQATYRAAMKPSARNRWLKQRGITRPGKDTAVPRGHLTTADFVRLHRAGRSAPEIAEALGCSKETVARRLKAARAEGLIP